MGARRSVTGVTAVAQGRGIGLKTINFARNGGKIMCKGELGNEI
jgi:hypothetical protein